MSGLAGVGLSHAHAWIAVLSQAATGSLVAAVWQGILLATAVGLGLRLLPKTPAAARFAIWFGAFTLVAALPALSLLPRRAGVARTGGHAWFLLNDGWCLAIAAVWLTASAARGVSLTLAALRVRALWKRATPVELEGVAQLGSRRAQVCTSDEIDRPTVIGFFAPKILIPAWLLEKLTPAQLEQIVLHEAGHLGRADDWMNLLQKIALVVFPLNPALAWVERRLCFERELAVDERVLQAFAGKAGAAKAYAACLATLAEYRLGRQTLGLALGALGRESELSRRVGRILRRDAGMKPLHSKLVLGGAMLGLLVAAAGFERCPQVVGFASRGSLTGGSEAQWQPTRGDETAMNGVPGLAVNRTAGRAIAVVYKTPVNRQIDVNTHVAHQVLAGAELPALRQNVDAMPSSVALRPVKQPASGSAKMVQTLARISGGRNGSRTISDVEPSQPAGGLTQWVVVTAWQNGQPTRMVFTTTTLTDAAGPQAVPAPEASAGEGNPSADQAPSYAAVPVRGGWLVFQL